MQQTKFLSTHNTMEGEKTMPLIYNPTINQQIRNKLLYKTDQGVPFVELYKKGSFKPTNSRAARHTIEGKDLLMMKDNPHEMSKIMELEDKHRQKQAQLAGPFRRSNVFDNNGLPDWTKDSK